MPTVNRNDYIYGDHEDLLYRVALELKRIETDYPPEPNQRRLVEILPDIQNQKLRISISLDAFVSLGLENVSISANPRYFYEYPNE